MAPRDQGIYIPVPKGTRAGRPAMATSLKRKPSQASFTRAVSRASFDSAPEDLSARDLKRITNVYNDREDSWKQAWVDARNANRGSSSTGAKKKAGVRLKRPKKAATAEAPAPKPRKRLKRAKAAGTTRVGAAAKGAPKPKKPVPKKGGKASGRWTPKGGLGTRKPKKPTPKGRKRA